MEEKASDVPNEKIATDDGKKALNKKVWTELERLELAAKLDKDLEDYMNNLDKEKYSDGWPEDRWQEEMEKHPFFMTELPEDPTKVSPLIEGLQQLKYSEEYNTPNELAQSYKEDGNFNYKYKKFWLAILCFSKGIETKCEDTELMAQLYNNRALAHLQLQNHRSGLNDCKQALKLSPNYLKALHTAVKCSDKLKEYDECSGYCDQILNILEKDKQTDDSIVAMRANAAKSKKLLERDSRLQDLKEKKDDQTKEKILETVKAKNIKTDKSDLFYDSQYYVHLDKEGMLVWPVIFAYPENNQTDFIQNFHESTILRDQLVELFKEPPAWDSNKHYQVENLNIYFEGEDGMPCKVDVNQTLGKIMQREKYIVRAGTPMFYALVAGSGAEHSFLESGK